MSLPGQSHTLCSFLAGVAAGAALHGQRCRAEQGPGSVPAVPESLHTAEGLPEPLLGLSSRAVQLQAALGTQISQTLQAGSARTEPQDKGRAQRCKCAKSICKEL